MLTAGIPYKSMSPHQGSQNNILTRRTSHVATEAVLWVTRLKVSNLDY